LCKLNPNEDHEEIDFNGWEYLKPEVFHWRVNQGVQEVEVAGTSEGIDCCCQNYLNYENNQTISNKMGDRSD